MNMKVNYLGPMFNDFSKLDMPSMFAQISKSFEKGITMSGAITLDVKDSVTSVGSTETIQLPVKFGKPQKLAKGEKSTVSSVDVDTADVPVDTHLSQHFAIGDREIAEMLETGTITDSIRAQTRSLTDQVGEDLIGTFDGAAHVAGGSGTKFGLNSVIAGREKMFSIGVERAHRHMLVGVKNSSDLLKANISGYDPQNPAYSEGKHPRVAGFNILEDEVITTVYGGANANFPAAMTVSSIVLLSANEIPVTGLQAGEQILDGDKFKIAGHKRFYTAVGNYDETATAITVKEALPSLAGGEAITATTTEDSYEAAYAWHPVAVAGVFRSLSVPKGFDTNVNVFKINAPNTGIPIKFSYWYDYDYGQLNIKQEILYGASLVRPDAATIVLADD